MEEMSEIGGLLMVLESGGQGREAGCDTGPQVSPPVLQKELGVRFTARYSLSNSLSSGRANW